MNEKNCLICGDVTSRDSVGSAIPGSPGWTTSTNPTSCAKLEHDLTIVLLLRKVLGLSQNRLESLLLNFGDPTDWGITLCNPCNRVFVELQFVHSRLVALSTEFDELSNRLRKQLAERAAAGDILPKKLSASTTKIKARNRGKRGRKPTKGSHNGSKPEQLPVDFIYQGFWEGKMKTTSKIESNLGTSKIKNTLKEKLPGPIVVKKEIVTSSEEIHDTSFNQQAATDDHQVTDNIVSQESPECQPIDLDEDFHCDDDGNNEDIEEYRPSSSKEDDGSGSDDLSNDDDEKDLDYGSKRKKKRSTSRTTQQIQVDKTEDFDPFTAAQPIKCESDYKCPFCGRKALTKMTSHGHILRAHYNQSNPYPCHLCPSRFRRDVRLRLHLELDHDSATTPLDDPDEVLEGESFSIDIPSKITIRKFECDICPKTKYKVLYESQETLDAHKKQKHLGIDKPYTCKLCNKSFKLQTMLRFHMYTHQRLEKEKKKTESFFKKLSCDKCGLSFTSLSRLQSHLRTKQHTPPPYQCELCPKGFFQKYSLQNHHAQEHYKELNLQPFKCTFCESVLSSQRARDHHIRIIHTKDTTYRCEPCGLGFMHNHIYKRHLAVVHAKERDLLCSYCPKRFSCKNHLETHLRTHTGEKPYKCPHCSRAYSDKPTYRRHLETHGQQVYHCTVCQNKSFKVWHSYRTHMKTHNQEVRKNWRSWHKFASPPTAETNSTVTNAKNEDLDFADTFDESQTLQETNLDSRTASSLKLENVPHDEDTSTSHSLNNVNLFSSSHTM